MRVADLDFQTRSLRGRLWETCKSGPIRPVATLKPKFLDQEILEMNYYDQFFVAYIKMTIN
jgi:hypothetical protein